MYAVRLHGRGGQGIVTTAELLALAAFDEGTHAQAFPTFGSERTGAPVAAFCRLDEVPIRSHEPITEPDALIVADLSLFDQVDVVGGLRPGGYLIVNASPGSALPPTLADGRARVVMVDASEIGHRRIGRAVPGPALLGAFVAASGRVGLCALRRAIAERFSPALAQGNADAASEAYDLVRGATYARAD